MNLQFSVIICTHTRAGYLSGAIRSLQSQDFSAEQFEIVVVDNGSTDDTEQVAHSFSEGVPECRYISESVM